MEDHKNLTLLPLADFAASASVLDDARLRSCMSASLFLLKRFQRGQTPTRPPGLLWHGYVPALATLGLYYAAEVAHRETRQPLQYAQLHEIWKASRTFRKPTVLPYWFGDSKLHLSHKRWLVKQDKSYKKKFPGVKSGDLWFPQRKVVY